MAATLIRHIQIRNQGVYNDTVTPNVTNFETNPTTLRDDVNNLVSAIKNLKGASNNWYDDFDGSADNLRPVSTLGTDLATVEDKRFLFRNQLINDVTVGAGNNYVILGAGEIPSALYDVAAIVTTTVGSVAAFHAGTFGTHSLDEIAGPNALNPLNLVTIRDADTFDSITSGGREVFALFQYEQNVDGGSITTTTPNRVQLSFVRSNAGGTDLEAVPVADIEGRVINYANPVRVAYLNIPEWAFITGLFVDQAAATDVTLTNAIANQVGEAPQGKNIDVAVASTFSWDFLAGSGGSSIANFANNAGVATLTLGSAGTAVTTVAGATLDINVTNPVTIASSLVVEDGGNPDVRIAGTAGAGTIDTATGALSLVGASGLNATATTGNVAITSTAAAVTIDGAGLVEINSSGAAINIGNDADAFAINVGTGAAARSITVGNATGATSVNLDSGTGGFTFDSTVGGGAAFATVTTSGADGDSVSWFVSDLDPSAGAGVAAPVGSMLWRDQAGGGTVGQVWVKTGAADTAWEQVRTGTSGADTLQTAYVNGNTIVTDAGNGPLDVSGTEAISLDAGAASNFTVTGGNLVLETVTSGSVDVNSAAAVTIDSTTGMSLTSGGTASFQSAGAMSILTQTGSGNPITVSAGSGPTDTAGGALTMSSGNGAGTGNGGVITLTAGAGGLTGVGGDITVTAGAGGSTSGNGGNLFLSAGLPVDGNGGLAALVGRDGVGTDRDGGSAALAAGDSTGSGSAGSVSGIAGTGTSTGEGGDVLFTAGDGNRAGNVNLTAGNGLSTAGGNLNFNAGNGAGTGNSGGGVTINSGGAADGNGGDISLVASAGTGTDRDGGDIFLSSGLNTGTGAAGTIQLRTPANIAVGQSWQVAQLNNRGTGTGGGQVMGLYTGTADPSHTAPTGSLFLFDNNSTGRVYVNVSAGGSGTTWQELTTAASTASRLFFQDTVASAVSAGNNLTGTDMTGGVLPAKPASITNSATFATFAEVYINGVLQFNGAANDVDFASGTDIALVLASVSSGDVVTIIYFNNI